MFTRAKLCVMLVLFCLLFGFSGSVYAHMEVESLLSNPPLCQFANLGKAPGAISPQTNLTSLIAGADGLIYGTTQLPTHLFTLNPSDNSITDKGAPPSDGSGDNGLLVWGTDNILYGANATSIWAYDPVGGSFTPKGQIPDGQYSVGMMQGTDGLLYLGTGNAHDGRLYSYNPASNAFHLLKSYSILQGSDALGDNLMAAPNGKIFGGIYPGGYLFVYDPVSTFFTNLGVPFELHSWDSGITALVAGNDGKLYGGRGGHIFSYDPNTNSFSDKGLVLNGLTRASGFLRVGGKIYGGIGINSGAVKAHVFEYDIATQAITELGIPVQNESSITALAMASTGMIYGGAGGATIFSFSPGCRPLPPSLTSNYADGQPGSFLTLTGSHFPAGSLTAIIINGQTITNTLPIDDAGSFTFILDTSQAGAGRYFVTTSVNPSASTSFILDPAAPLRVQEGSGAILEVPNGIAFTTVLYLPFVKP